MATQEEGTCLPEINRWNGAFSDSMRVVARWCEHFQKLLNVPGDIDHDHDNIPQRITKTNLDEIPTMTEMVRAIAGLKGDKAPGGCVRYSWEDLAMATTEDVWMPREVHNYDRGSTYWNDGEC